MNDKDAARAKAIVRDELIEGMDEITGTSWGRATHKRVADRILKDVEDPEPFCEFTGPLVPLRRADQ